MTTFERHRACGQPAEVSVLADSVASQLYILRAASQDPKIGGESIRERLRLLFVELDRTLETVTIDECPFAGDVDVTAHGQMGPSVRLTWTCPTCRHEHEETGD